MVARERPLKVEVELPLRVEVELSVKVMLDPLRMVVEEEELMAVAECHRHQSSFLQRPWALDR